MKYLIGLILIALPSYLIRFDIFGIPTTALEIAIYTLFVAYIISRQRLSLPPRDWLIPIALFFFGAVIGVLISPDKLITLGQFKGFIFDPILFALVLYSALRSKIVDKDWIVYSLLGTGIVLTLGAFWFPDHLDGRSLSFYWYEVSPNPNYLALILAPIAAMAFSRLKYFAPAIALDLDSGVGFLMLLAIVISGSRGAFIGLGLAILYILYKKYKKFQKPIIALVFAFLLLIFYLAKPDLSATPDSGRVSSSNNIRYEIWKTTAEMVTENPQNFVLGVGLGNYQNYFTNLTKDRVNYPEFIAPRALTPHNIFLATWVNGGLVMLVGLVWLVYLIFRRGKFLPAQVALVALVSHGLVDTPYFKNDLSVLFWTLVVLAMIEQD